MKKTVVPLLLEGEPNTSLRPLLRRRVRCDFRDDRQYFDTALDLLVSLYRIPPRHAAVHQWKQQLGQHSIE